MDELSIVLGASLDLDEIKKQIDSLKDDDSLKVKITADTESVKKILGDLQKTVGAKSNAVKILVDVNRNDSRQKVKEFVDGLKNTYKANPIKLAFGVDLKATNSNIKSAIQAIKQELNNQKFEVNLTTQNAKQQGNKNLPGIPAGNQNVDPKLASVSLTTQYDKEGNEQQIRQQEKYNEALGQTLTITKDLVNETETRTETTNYEAQAKALQKTNEFLAQQETLYRKLNTDIINESNPLTGQYKDAADEARTVWKDMVDQAKAANKVLSDEEKAQIKELADYSLDVYKQQRNAQNQSIKEQQAAQKALADEERQRAKDQEMYTRQMDSRVKTDDSTQAKVLSDIANAQAELERMKQSFFSGDKALTGDYATKATTEINDLAQSFDKLKEKATSSVEEARKVTKDGLSNSLKDLQAQLRQIQKQEYPADKLAPKNVDVLKSDYASKIAAFREQLNEAGLGTSEFANRLADLETKLQSVGKIDNTGTPWAEWKADFEGLENKFKEFGNSVDGMKLKLSQSIGTDQLQTIDQLSERLSSLPEKLQGSGTEALKTNLQNLATEYQNVVNQLGADDLTKEQFDALTAKVKQLDDQLKQAANAAKIFGDGFKNEQAIQKYNLDVENLTNRFERLKKMYEDFIAKNPSKANGDIVSQITAFQTRLNSIDPTNITEINKEFRNLSGVVRDAISPSQTLSQILSQNFGALGQMVSRYASFAFIMQKVISVTKSMISEVRSLDSSLVELQKVTTLSGQSLSDFADRAYDVGAKLGRTGKDVIDAVTTFSRAGYDLNEATQMAESALVMTNVGVDIPNIESAASDMISIMTAFDKKAEESMSVIDKLYNVANKEPLDFGNITQMLVTSGGTLAQTGTSLEETMGLLTAAFKTLRDNSVSNG